MKSEFTVLALLTILLSALIGGVIGDRVVAGSAPADSYRDLLKPFTEALDVIQRTYVEEVDSQKLVHSAIRGMLRSLDPHSSFFDKREFARLREDQQSKYSGLGIRVRSLTPGSVGRVVIAEPPFPGSPASKKGLRAGDVITHIEGEPIDDWPLDEVISNIKGPKGTKVRITIERPGLGKPLDLEIVRDEISIHTIDHAFMIRPGIAYIKINRFSESTGDELDKKIKALEAEAEIKGLILDLRGNPGGLLSQGVEIASRFVPEGQVIVSTRGRADGSVKEYKARGGPKYSYPLVVLIDRQSASASEIVAGAIQDHDRGLIVGETSFGKGLVQSVYPLDDNMGLALTTARWYTPSDRLIQRSFSGSIFDYLYSTKRSRQQERSRSDIHYTDSGREVYGGGGITPDVVLPAHEPSRLESLLYAKDAFFKYASKLTSGKVASAGNFAISPLPPEVARSSASTRELMNNLQITPAILEDFKQFLREQNIEFTEQEFATDLEMIKRKLKEQAFNSLFGIQEGYRIAIEGDEQVLKAIELLPQAEKLMLTAKAALAKKRPLGSAQTRE